MPIETLINAVKRWAERTFATRGDVGEILADYVPRLEDGSVTDSILADGSVTSEKLADGSVTGEKLSDGSVTNEKLTEDSVMPDNAGFYVGNWEVTPPNILENECGVLLESYRVRPTNKNISTGQGWNRFYVAIPVYGFGQGFVTPAYANVIVDDVAAVKVTLADKYHPTDFGYVESTGWMRLKTVTLNSDSVVKFKFYDENDVEINMVGKPCRVAWLRNTQKEVLYQPNIPGIIEHVNGYTDASIAALEARVAALEGKA